LGTGTFILADGVQVGQDGAFNNPNPTGNDQTDRAVANAMQINGNVTFGVGSFATHFGGNVDLTGANRTISLTNTAYLYGTVTNGGLVIDNGSGSGNRTLYMYGANTFSGGVVVNSNAIVGVGNDSALGSGSLVFTNTSGNNTSKLLVTTLATNASQTRTITNSIGLASGINVTLDSDTTAQDSVGANATVNTDAILSGAITGSGALSKAGASTVTLSGANSYSGGTTVNAGTLLLSGSGTLGSTSGALSIGAGTVNLGGLARTNGAFTLDSGTLSNGTLTASSYALTNAGTV
jgi:autotransporter-associated beta strand protein